MATDSPIDEELGKLTSNAETGSVVLEARIKGVKSRVYVRQTIINGDNVTGFPQSMSRTPQHHTIFC